MMTKAITALKTARYPLAPRPNAARRAGDRAIQKPLVQPPAVSARPPSFRSLAAHGSQQPNPITILKEASVRRLEKGGTTAADFQAVWNMCCEINPNAGEEIFQNFWQEVAATRLAMPKNLQKRDQKLPSDWYKDPWYVIYPQYFGCKDDVSRSTFEDLISQLDYLQSLGFRNLELLPHYESPGGDGGYDVSAYKAHSELGGQEGFEAFMAAATAKGFRVVTDLIINHTSERHHWFQQALQGDQEKLGYYLQRPGRQKIHEWDESGDKFCLYRDHDGVESKRLLIFPDISNLHHRQIETSHGQVQIYSEFYPFQLDLDLQNPKLLGEIFSLLSIELCDGVLGKRADAVAHWIKKPGTTADGLSETHALLGLIKAFMRQVSPKAIVIPEAVREIRESSRYFGIPTHIRGEPAPSEGDLSYHWELQAAIKLMVMWQQTGFYWDMMNRFKYDVKAKLPPGATLGTLLDHHDEIYLGMFPEENRDGLRRFIESKGGIIYKNGMSAGARLYGLLDGNDERMANAIFIQYMAPGAPMVYYGNEVGAHHNHPHMEFRQSEQHATFKEHGLNLPHDRCRDPRELHRGPISKQRFDEALQDQKPQIRILQTLNRLQRQWPALRSHHCEPLPNGNGDVLSQCLYSDDPGDQPLMGLVNLSGEPRWVHLPLHGADGLLNRLKLGHKDLRSEFRFRDLLAEGERIRSEREAHGELHIELLPYDRMLLTCAD